MSNKSMHVNIDLVVALFFGAFSLLLLVWLIPCYVAEGTIQAGDISPRFFPRMIVCVMVALSIALWYQAIRTTSSETIPEEQRINKNTAVLALIFICCYFGILLFGMFIATVATMVVLMLFFRIPNKLLGICLGATVLVALYFFFEKVALVNLPVGSLFQ